MDSGRYPNQQAWRQRQAAAGRRRPRPPGQRRSHHESRAVLLPPDLTAHALAASLADLGHSARQGVRYAPGDPLDSYHIYFARRFLGLFFFHVYLSACDFHRVHCAPPPLGRPGLAAGQRVTARFHDQPEILSYQLLYYNIGVAVKLMAGTAGLEPATSDVTGRRSSQLNYAPVLNPLDTASSALATCQASK